MIPPPATRHPPAGASGGRPQAGAWTRRDQSTQAQRSAPHEVLHHPKAPGPADRPGRTFRHQLIRQPPAPGSRSLPHATPTPRRAQALHGERGPSGDDQAVNSPQHPLPASRSSAVLYAPAGRRRPVRRAAPPRRAQAAPGAPEAEERSPRTGSRGSPHEPRSSPRRPAGSLSPPVTFFMAPQWGLRPSGPA